MVDRRDQSKGMIFSACGAYQVIRSKDSSLVLRHLHRLGEGGGG